MTKKSQLWNDGLMQDLRDPAFAAEFIQAAIEEGASIQEVLEKVVKAYGVQAMARKTHIASPNILRAIDHRHNPTQATLNRLLKPFGLTLGVQILRTRST